MRDATPGLISLLASGAFVECDLYTITLVGGSVIRLTTADVDIKVGSDTWASRGPRIDDTQAQIRWTTGFDVDTLTFSVVPREIDPFTGTADPDLIGNQTWLAAAITGALDGAVIQVDTAYWPQWPTPWASPLTPTEVLSAVFAGRVAGVDPNRVSIGIDVNSHLELLNTLMPRRLYSAGCRFTLFDAGCQLLASSFKKSGSVGVGSTPSAIVSSITAPSGSGTYALGQIVMTSGANAGSRRMVKSWDGTTLKLMAPLRATLNTGDTFDAYPGCDKQASTCTAFSNLVNFGGQPYIPAPETAI